MFFRQQLRELERDGTVAAPAFTAGLERFDLALVGSALLPPAELPMLGAWAQLTSDLRPLLADGATLRSKARRVEAITPLRVRVAELQRVMRARFGKTISRLPPGLLR